MKTKELWQSTAPPPLLLLSLVFVFSIIPSVTYAGTLEFDGVPVDITTSANEDLVIAPGTGGNTQIGDASGTNSSATSNDDLHITGVLEIDGVTYCDGALTTSAGITSGSNIISDTDSTDSLGTTAKAWLNLFVDYIKTVSGNNLTLYGTGTSDSIILQPNADTDDYLTFSSLNNVPTILGTGAYVRIGDASTAANVSTEDDLFVSGSLEVGGTLYTEGGLTSSGGQTVTVDDATTDDITNVLTVEHTTTGTPAANIGTGIAIHTEDAGGSEEQASIDVQLTTVTDEAEDADMVFSVNKAGTITEMMRIDSSDAEVQIGANGTDGKLTLFSEQGGTDYLVSLQPHATMTEATAYTMPPADGSSGQMLSTDGSAALSWATVSSDSVGDADGDTQIQVEESADEDIIRFDTAGNEVMTIDATGDFVFTPSTDSATGFKVMDSDGGTSVFNVDTDNERVGIGTDAPGFPLHIVSGNTEIKFTADGSTSKIDLKGSDTTSTNIAQHAGNGLTQTNSTWRWSSATVRPAIRGNSTDVIFGMTEAFNEGLGFPAANTVALHTANTERMRIDSSGNVGIGEVAPVTQLEMTGTAPYLTLHNNTDEDTDGGRESQILFRGEQSGAEETILAQIQASHDGTADDEKGDLIFYVNDGDDGTSPTEALRLASDATATFAGTISGTVSGYATTELDNLGTVAVSESLISDADSTDDLGSSSKQWANLYVDSVKCGTVTDLTIENDGQDKDIIFKVNDGGSDTEIMRIDGSVSMVGIGTAAPKALVHLVGTDGLLQLGDSEAEAGKEANIVGSHQESAEEPVTIIRYNGDGSNNHVHIGGGDSAYNAAGFIKFYSAANDTTLSGTERMRISTGGHVNIGPAADSSYILQVKDAQPYFHLWNTSHENTEGGRESQILFRGEQSGGEETILAQIQASHDGTADDEKGDLIFYVNDGDDGTSPTEALRLASDGTATFAGTISGGGIDLDAAFDAGKEIDGANEFANAVLIGDGTDKVAIAEVGGIPTIYGTGGYLRIGDAGTTGHSLDAEDDLLVSGELEVDGAVYLDNTLNVVSATTAATFNLGQTGSGGSAEIDLKEDGNLRAALKANYTFDEMVLLVTDSVGDQLIVSNFATNDHDHAPQTNPTLYVQSATNPNTNNTQWLSLTHDQTDGVIATGTGSIALKPSADTDDYIEFFTQNNTPQINTQGGQVLVLGPTGGNFTLTIGNNSSTWNNQFDTTSSTCILYGAHNKAFTIKQSNATTDVAPKNMALAGANALAAASTNLDGGDIDIDGGAGASSSAGDADGGHVYIDGGANYGTGSAGNVILAGTRGNLGIGEVAPVTQLEMTGTAPYLTLHNSTEENTEGGRESQIIFRGEQDGTEETILAQIQASHDGTADDEKGDLIFYVNDGDDGTSPTEALRLASDGTATFAGTISGGGIDLDSAFDAGKEIDGANEFANAVLIGDGTDKVAIAEVGGIPSIYGTGGYLRIGDAGTTSRSLDAEDDLMVTGELEVDGNSYFDGTYHYFAGDILPSDDKRIRFGSGPDTMLGWFTTQATENTLLFGLGDTAKSIIFCDTADTTQDFDHAAQTNPTLFIHSATDPDTANTQWLSLTHDQTDGVITTGLGDLILSPASNVGIGTDAPGAPLEVVSTDAGATSNNTIFRWDSSSPADNDELIIPFQLDDSNGAAFTYGKLRIRAGDITSGSETSELYINLFRSGTERNMLRFGTSHIVFNEDSQDVDYRFESDDNANALTINGGTNSVGIGEIAPVTMLEMTGTAPYLTLHNSSEENTEGGRESQIIFRGEQDGTEETILAQIQASHDGTADDEKGDLIFYVNDGDDGTSPTEAMRINSDASVTFAGATSGITSLADADNDTKVQVEESADEDIIRFDTAGNEVASIDATGDAIFQTSTDSTTGFQVMDADGGTPILNVDTTNERVGIGTNAPTRLLQAYGVNAIISVMDSTRNREVYLQSTDTTAVLNTPNPFTISSSNNLMTLEAGDGAGDGFDFTRNTASYVRFDGETGNVGIGTTGPGAKLEIADGGNLKLSGANASGEGNIVMGGGPSGSYDTNLFMLDSDTKTLGFIAGDTAAFTSANGPLFGARGNDYTAIADQQGILFFYAGNPTSPSTKEGQIRFATGNNVLRMIINKDGDIGMGGTISDAGTLAGSNVFIDNGGNVGIGTASPTPSANTDVVLMLEGAVSPAIRLNDTGQANPWEWMATSDDLRGRYGTTDIVTFQNDGNVGIGTTSPGELLHLQAATTTSVLLENTGDSAVTLKMSADRDATDEILGSLNGMWDTTTVAQIQSLTGDDTGNKDDGYIVFKTSEGGSLAERMRIEQAGNVGIGTTAPGAKLDVISTDYPVMRAIREVAGNGALSGAFTLARDNTYDGGSVTVNDGVGFSFQLKNSVDAYNNYAGVYGQILSATDGSEEGQLAFAVQNAGGSLSSNIKMVIDNSGNVGIGTTAPGNPLAVNRSADGVIVDFESADTVEGTISIAGNTTSYNAFMGSHWTQLKESQQELPVGTIIISSGEIIPSRKGEDEAKFPYIEKSQKRAQRGVYGVWHAKMSEDAKDHSFGDPDKPIYQIAALGLYYVRVTDTNGNIRNGDFIQSSPRAGEGERQEDDLLHSYTVAKTLVDVNWEQVEVDPEYGYKWKLIPATLHAG